MAGRRTGSAWSTITSWVCWQCGTQGQCTETGIITVMVHSQARAEAIAEQPPEAMAVARDVASALPPFVELASASLIAVALSPPEASACTGGKQQQQLISRGTGGKGGGEIDQQGSRRPGCGRNRSAGAREARVWGRLICRGARSKWCGQRNDLSGKGMRVRIISGGCSHDLEQTGATLSCPPSYHTGRTGTGTGIQQHPT